MKKRYQIDYCVYTTMGKLRKNNEDNYYVEGKYRQDVASTKDECLCGTFISDANEMVAVFDGMGGEACGEIASLVAAKACNAFRENRLSYEEYLYELCEICNKEVLNETKERSLVLMGTTGCMIQFSNNEVYVLNVGDSRIYKLSHHKLNQISVDHVAAGYSNKAPITKFLGMPIDDTQVNPYIAMGSYKVGDLYLACTDGITDLISDDEIKEILSEKGSIDRSAKKLIDLAMDRGGVDNATLAICKIAHRKFLK